MSRFTDLDGNYFTVRQLFVRGVTAVVVVGVAVSAVLANWAGLFERHVSVVAQLHNIGDGLPAQSDVKFRGLLVGAVEQVKPAIGGRPNEILIRLNAATAAAIPANVTARVVPSNVFAVSSLQLVEPKSGAADAPRMRSGARVAEDTTAPTVLFQTTVSKLRDVLAAAARGRDDRSVGVLAAVAAATNNRRSELMTSAAQLNRLIDQLNNTVSTDPTDATTLSALTEAASGLTQTAPDLADALFEAVEPMRTLAEREVQLQSFLAAGSRTAATSAESLHNQTDRLIQITTDLTPVLGVLAQNAHHFVPITQRITRFSDTFFEQVWDSELDTPRGRVNLSFTPSYTYTRADCPRYGELLGPSCFTAPLVPVRAELPEVLLPQNYQPPAGLAPPPGTVIGPDGNLVAVGPPLVNPHPDLRDPHPPLPPWMSPSPPVPGTSIPPMLSEPAPEPPAPAAAPASFGGSVGSVGSAHERDQLSRIAGRPADTATQLILGPVARGSTVAVNEEAP